MSNIILKSEFQEIVDVKEKTFPEYYLAKADYYAKQGRDVWLIDGLTDEKRYYGKFDEETKKLASGFHKLGLRKGDVVIYMIKELVKVHILLTSIWRANAIARATYPEDDAETILHRVKESNVKLIVCEEDAVDLLKKVSAKVEAGINIVTVKRNSFGLPSLKQILEEDDGSNCPSLQITGEDFALILCTSGTTGFSKGAVYTHQNLLYQIRSIERCPFTPHKLNFLSTKATHISGCMLAFALLGTGKSGVVLSNVTAENIFRITEKHKPGFILAFPSFLAAMTGPEGAAYDFSSLEVIGSGGCVITPAMRKAFFQLPNVKDFLVWYGLTECAICTTNAVLKEDNEKETPTIRNLPEFSVGKIFPGTEIQIRDIETLEVVGPNIKGEVCVKNQNGIFHSYCNNSKATEEAFIDGYLRTGDVGYYDEAGFFYIVDRCKDIFKYFNDHISSAQIEDVIGKHPKVVEVCVIGVEDIGGCVPRAFVVAHPSSSLSRQQLAEEIKMFANDNLASYKHLRGGLYIVDELPKGKTGKVTRKLVEQLKLPY